LKWRVWNAFALRKACVAAAAAIVASGALCGCVENAADLNTSSEQAQFVRRPDANMSGAPLAIMSVDGAPDDLAGAFQQRLDQASAERQIATAAPADAKYLARGYLNATLVQNGAIVDIVWDVFTPDKQRVQRLSDTMVVQGSGDDPWALINDAALASIANRSADDLAAYLSNTPEAAPGAAAALSYAE